MPRPSTRRGPASPAATIRALQDLMRQDVGVDGDAQRIGQLVWLLFLKIWDDRERAREQGEPGFASPLVDVTWTDAAGARRTAADLRWRAWAADPARTGEPLLAFVDGTLFPALRGLEPGPADDPRHRQRALIRAMFADTRQHMRSGALLRRVVDRVDASVHLHLLGDVYEQILRDLQSAGNAGEYYTPRAVTQFAVDMVDPRLGEVVLDPACGTGGFLACAVEHVRRRHVRTPADEATLQASIRGVEKKPLPHLLCATNMVLHGLDVPSGIRRGNALARPGVADDERVDVVLTNPPFGGLEEDEIAAGFPPELRTRDTADLFLVQIAAVLRDGGRAAVVLPDGTLFGGGVKARVKERLLRTCDVHTLVRLPGGVFAPYTAIPTNLVFFTRGRPTREVWYYQHPTPPGRRRYAATRPLHADEFAEIRAWWPARAPGPRAWRVSIAEIEARGFDLDVPNPHAAADDLADPDELLAQYAGHAAAAADLREQLRAALVAARTGRT